VIQLESVGFVYDGQEGPALDGVSFASGPGRLVCATGAECSGKTTLFRLLNGTAPRVFPGTFSGSIRVDGSDPTERGHAEIGAIITSVFDDPDSQIISLTVEEEVAFALVQRGLEFDEIARRVSDALARVGLAGFERRHTASLSGGQKQRLVMASAVALRPRILLVDEGTSALDPEGARRFFSIVDDMRARDGTTAVVIERDLDLMLEFADEILVFARGRLAFRGSPAEACQKPSLLRDAGLRLPAWLELADELRERGLLEGKLPASEAEAVAAIGELVPAGAAR